MIEQRLPGQLIDGSQGSMIKLAESLSLSRAINRDNDPLDPYYMEEHQVVFVGFQRGVTSHVPVYLHDD